MRLCLTSSLPVANVAGRFMVAEGRFVLKYFLVDRPGRKALRRR
jgi:hypothetical protein